MILVTGGLGFIGVSVAQALLELGESCVLTQRSTTRRPASLADEIGKRIFIEQLDVSDLPALLEIDKRHKITGITHLAAPGAGALDVLDDLRMNAQGLFNVLQAARVLEVPRVSVASSIGVYVGASGSPLREDMPLPMVGSHSIETVKKSFELFDTLVAAQTGLEIVNMRLSAIWGPYGRAQSRFFAAPGLVHAAMRGETLDFSAHMQPVYAGDGIDLCYVKDCGRAIALLQTTRKLNHQTYNVGSGRATTNKEVVRAIKRVIPEANLRLAEGRSPHAPDEDAYLDITRIQKDTGYEPAYGVERGAADYIQWLRSGHER